MVIATNGTKQQDEPMLSYSEIKPSEVDIELAEEEQGIEDDKKEPVHWLKRSPVMTRALPLEPGCLVGEVKYVTQKGNITIIDRKYACLRVGQLLTSLGYTENSLEDPEFGNFLAEAIAYAESGHQKDVDEIANEKAKVEFLDTARKLIPGMKKVARSLQQFEKLGWTEEQWIEHIKKTS